MTTEKTKDCPIVRTFHRIVSSRRLHLPRLFLFGSANLTQAQRLCLCLEITNLSGDILLKNPVSGLFTHVTRIEIVTRDFIGRRGFSGAPVKLLLKTCYGTIERFK